MVIASVSCMNHQSFVDISGKWNNACLKDSTATYCNESFRADSPISWLCLHRHPADGERVSLWNAGWSEQPDLAVIERIFRGIWNIFPVERSCGKGLQIQGGYLVIFDRLLILQAKNKTSIRPAKNLRIFQTNLEKWFYFDVLSTGL